MRRCFRIWCRRIFLRWSACDRRRKWWSKFSKTRALAKECRALADEVEQALQQYAIVHHAKLGQVYAYEVDGYGNYYCIDDGNVPSLLSLPYLGAVKPDDQIYQNTRKLVLSGCKSILLSGQSCQRPGRSACGNEHDLAAGLNRAGIDRHERC